MEIVTALKKHKLLKKLNNREKNLLILLGIVLVLWLAFRFIITPQYERIRALEEEKNSYDGKVSQINSMLKKEDSIDKELRKLQVEKTVLMNSNFLSLNQSEIINLLDEILSNENFEVQDIEFSEPVEEKIGNINIKRMNIDIPYKSDYTGVAETLKAISSSPKKIIVNSLIMDKDEDNLLTGTISLAIYSLNNVLETNEGSLSTPELTENYKSNPFIPFESYVDNNDEINVNEEINYKDYSDFESDFGSIIPEEKYDKVLLEDFESGSFELIPSNKYVNGNVLISNTSKSNKNSLRLEYNILAIEDENKVFIDLTGKNIAVKYPPISLGMWVYSYEYSPVVLGIRLKGQNNEQIDIPVSKGISWIGWNYIEASLPQDLTLYPLQIDKIYLDLANNREDYGVLLLDKLEANYSKNSNSSSKSYLLHIVEKGETLDSISMKYYNTKSKKNIIMKYNDMKTEYIAPGRILVIPK